MSSSIWEEVLGQMELPFEESDKWLKRHRKYKLIKAAVSAACLVVTIVAVSLFLNDNRNRNNEILVSSENEENSMYDLAGGKVRICPEEERKYRIVRYEMPPIHETADLYIKTLKTEGYLQKAVDVVKKCGLGRQEDDFVGAFFLPLFGEVKEKVLGLIKPNVLQTGLDRMYYLGFDEQGTCKPCVNFFQAGEDKFLLLLEALAPLTSPSSPVMLVGGYFAEYAVIGDTAYYYGNPLSDYIDYMPDFLKDTGLSEDDFEIIKIEMGGNK